MLYILCFDSIYLSRSARLPSGMVGRITARTVIVAQCVVGVVEKTQTSFDRRYVLARYIPNQHSNWPIPHIPHPTAR